jgi:hypothetical protein
MNAMECRFKHEPIDVSVDPSSLSLCSYCGLPCRERAYRFDVCKGGKWTISGGAARTDDIVIMTPELAHAMFDLFRTWIEEAVLYEDGKEIDRIVKAD